MAVSAENGRFFVSRSDQVMADSEVADSPEPDVRTVYSAAELGIPIVPDLAFTHEPIVDSHTGDVLQQTTEVNFTALGGSAITLFIPADVDYKLSA